MNYPVYVNEIPEEIDTEYTIIGRIVEIIKKIIKLLFGDLPTTL